MCYMDLHLTAVRGDRGRHAGRQSTCVLHGQSTHPPSLLKHLPQVAEVCAAEWQKSRRRRLWRMVYMCAAWTEALAMAIETPTKGGRGVCSRMAELSPAAAVAGLPQRRQLLRRPPARAAGPGGPGGTWQVRSHGLQPQSLWMIPTAAVGEHEPGGSSDSRHSAPPPLP